MIHWLYPGALAGLALLTLPIVIHLLRTHRAERILFPSLRFVKPSRSAAVRVRPPSDLLLLCVRLLIVVAAVVAAAQPVLVTSGRIRGWDAAVARVVILDVGRSGSGAGGAATVTPRARELAANEATTATQSTLMQSSQLGDALVQAAEWLADAPPARREVVVISEFPLGAVGEEEVAALPPGTGVRLVQAGDAVASAAVAGLALLSAPGIQAETQDIELTGARTRLTLRPGANQQSGLRIISAAVATSQVDGLLRSVAMPGTPAPSPEQPIVVAFGDDSAMAAAQPIGRTAPRWMLRTMLRAQADPALIEAARGAAASALPSSPSWSTVANDREGRPMIRVAVLGDSLAAQVAAEPGSFVAAAALRALLQARAGDSARPDQEILRIPAARLAGWSRPASAVDAEAWRRVERSDARWFWLAALLLLGVEQLLRRVTSTRVSEVRRAA